MGEDIVRLVWAVLAVACLVCIFYEPPRPDDVSGEPE